MTRHEEIYAKYYETVIGRFYDIEQKERLLDLFLESAGIRAGSKEYNDIFNTVLTLENAGVESSIDCKNLKLIYGMIGLGGDLQCALNVLDSVYTRNEALEHSGHEGYKSFLDWVIALRTTFPKTNQIRFELAYLEYSNGNVRDAVSELEALVGSGMFEAVESIATIYYKEGNLDRVLFYYLLLKEVCETELMLTVPKHLEERLDELIAKVTETQLVTLKMEVKRMLPFMTNKKNPIGFLGQ